MPHLSLVPADPGPAGVLAAWLRRQGLADSQVAEGVQLATALAPALVALPRPRLQLVDPEAVDADRLIESWVTWMLAQGMAKRTVADRARVVAQVAREVRQHPIALTADGLTRWLASDIWKPATRRAYWTAVRAWSAWLIRIEHRTDDPTAGIPQPKVPRSLPRPISTAHLRVLLSTNMRRRTRTMILIAAYQGFRVSEIAAFRGEHVDLVDDTLRVIGKGGVDETVPLHPLIKAEAAEYPRRGWWFPSHKYRGRQMQANVVSGTISETFRRADVPGSAHCLRHWFGTTLLSSGANAREAQELLRHASLATTAIYTAIPQERRREALLRLPIIVAEPVDRLY